MESQELEAKVLASLTQKLQTAATIRASIAQGLAGQPDAAKITKSDINKVLYRLKREGKAEMTGNPAVAAPEWSLPATNEPAVS